MRDDSRRRVATVQRAGVGVVHRDGRPLDAEPDVTAYRCSAAQIDARAWARGSRRELRVGDSGDGIASVNAARVAVVNDERNAGLARAGAIARLVAVADVAVRAAHPRRRSDMLNAEIGVA